MPTGRAITTTVDFGEAGEKDVSFTVDYTPYRPAVGMFGPWEHAQPEQPSEAEITGAAIGAHDVLWMFDAEARRLIGESICEKLDAEPKDIEEPDYYREAT